MADKIDKLFSDYFSGVINMRIQVRRLELGLPKQTDENIGGGRALNVNRNPVDSKLIAEESDRELKYLFTEIRMIEEFLKTITNDMIKLLKWRYDTRDRHTWQLISYKMHKSKSQCQRDLNFVKEQFENSIWSRLVDMSM
ncbi:DUF722 domain-containing protein [Convivina intestini]|uniref:Uncharacterized protein DUF722 n=1 Tax=Convivina intestini TaxID=1505726 RepID=A0A2U1D2U7_9LACO|nr:DUF722 domain-containing protein [Convivina intestini]PVY82001.1 uncharacterized protein DUF722 [Convivina intestini]CAH1857599.1 hypothetical protein R077811_01625 [Convivina intestini]